MLHSRLVKKRYLMERSKFIPIYEWSRRKKSICHYENLTLRSKHFITKRLENWWENHIQRSPSLSIFSRFYPYIFSQDKSHRLRLTVSLSSMFLGKLTAIQTPLLLGKLIDTLLQNDVMGISNDASLPLTSSDVSTCCAVSPPQSLLHPIFSLSLVLGYGLARILSSGFNELRNAVFSKVSYSACSQVAHSAFQHLHRLDLDFLLHSKSGELCQILSRGIRSMTQLLNTLLFQVFPSVLEFSLVLWLLSWKVGMDIAGITCATMAGYVMFTAQVTKRRTLYRKEMNRAEQKASGVLLDSILNSESIRLFMNEANEDKKYCAIQHEYQEAKIKVAQSLAFLNFGQQFIFNLGLTSSMLLTTWHILSGHIPVGSLAFVSSLLFQLSIPLNMLGSVYRDTKLSLIDLEKLHELLSIKPSCVSLPNAKPLVLGPSTRLRYENVSFTYGEHLLPLKNVIAEGSIPQMSQNKYIFSNLCLDIQHGSKIGIIGTSGSGKSTLFKLLFRLYDTSYGRITIDGEDLRNLDLKSLRRHIGIVPQDVILFHDTILENLRVGNSEATYNEIVEATKAAQIYDTIMRNCRNGFNTIVGERGLILSGGEKQRIAIARCLLKKPSIFLLDEPTSALDCVTEEKILNHLHMACPGATILMIAHRLSTIRDMDRIYVLDGGRVAEFGTHDQLVALTNGVYAKMWEQQVRSRHQINAFITQDIRSVIQRTETSVAEKNPVSVETNLASVEPITETDTGHAIDANEIKDIKVQETTSPALLDSPLEQEGIETQQKDNGNTQTNVKYHDMSEEPQDPKVVQPSTSGRHLNRRAQYRSKFLPLELTSIKTLSSGTFPLQDNLSNEGPKTTDDGQVTKKYDSQPKEDNMIKRKEEAAKTIQAWWRGHLTRVLATGLIIQRRLRIGNSFESCTPKRHLGESHFDKDFMPKVQLINECGLLHKNPKTLDSPPPWSRHLVRLLSSFLSVLDTHHDVTGVSSNIERLYKSEMKRADVLGVGRVEVRAARQIRLSETKRCDIIKTWNLEELL